MMFHAGQKVCCIKDGRWRLTPDGLPGPPSIDGPQKGDVVTIAQVVADEDDCWLVLLGYDPMSVFHAKYFRPLVERKTDISIFRRILKDADKRIEVDA